MYSKRYFPVRFFAPRYFPATPDFLDDTGVVIRTIPADTRLEMEEIHTRPTYMVKMDFPDGSIFLSDTQQLLFNGDTYVAGGVRVNSFAWDTEGGQAGSIDLMNENNAATALILNNGVADVPITIYKTYLTGPNPTDFTTPVVVVSGVCDETPLIAPELSNVTVVSSRSTTTFAPNRYFSKAEGFNYLPKHNSVIAWAGEKYVLRGD